MEVFHRLGIDHGTGEAGIALLQRHRQRQADLAAACDHDIEHVRDAFFPRHRLLLLAFGFPKGILTLTSTAVQECGAGAPSLEPNHLPSI